MWEFAAGSRYVSRQDAGAADFQAAVGIVGIGFSISMIFTVAAFPHAFFGCRTSELFPFPGRNWSWSLIEAILPAEDAF